MTQNFAGNIFLHFLAFVTFLGTFNEMKEKIKLYHGKRNGNSNKTFVFLIDQFHSILDILYFWIQLKLFHHFDSKKTFFKRILFIRDIVCLLNIMPTRNFSRSIIWFQTTSIAFSLKSLKPLKIELFSYRISSISLVRHSLNCKMNLYSYKV